MKNKILITGTVAFDDIETPFGSSGKVIGGAGTYIALASSLFTKNLAIPDIASLTASLLISFELKISTNAFVIAFCLTRESLTKLFNLSLTFILSFAILPI